MTIELASPALSLRCRAAEWIERAESFEEFRRPAAAPTLHRELGLAELLITDHAARRWSGIERLGLPALTCETARFGILDALAHEHESTPLEHWHDQGEIVGELIAEPEQPDMLGMRVRRGLVALAAALPMLGSTLAEAAPPIPAPSLRDATVGEIEGQTEVEGPAPTTSAAPTTTATPTSEPAPTPTPAPAADPPPVAAPAVVVPDNSLSLSGRRLWKGLMDQPLVLKLKDGTELAGMVVAQSGSDLAFARASDGTVVGVPKAEVAGIQLRSSRPTTIAPNNAGAGLMTGGAIMIAGGSAFALAGTLGLAVYASYLYIHLPLLVTGLVLTGGGIGMLAAGKKKQKKATGQAKLQWAPTFGANRQGGQAGLILRF